MAYARLPLTLWFGLFWAGCGASTPEAQIPPGQEPPVDPAALEARLPSVAGPLVPSFLAITGTPPKGEAIAAVEDCARCHADVAASWRTSAHSYGSFNNPIYRSTVDRTRTEAGKKESRFCGGCHDISLMVDGAMTEEIAPTDARAHTGIACRTCHGIEEATNDGNASYTLNGNEIPLPSMSDPASIELHKQKSALKPLRTAELCASCHRAFLDENSGNTHHLPGMDDVTPWGRSIFAGSQTMLIDDEGIEEKDCRGCHMPLEPAVLRDAAATDGKIASHRFLGGHTWLASMRKDEDGLRRVQDFLRGAASIDVSVAILEDGTRVLPADGAPVRPGERITLDITMRNLRVGHRFPGGTMDAQDAWVELVVTDAKGAVIAQAGVKHREDPGDLSAHTLQSLQAGEGGVPQRTRETHKFRAMVWNHTLPPREAGVVEYEFEVPEGLRAEQLPLKAEARLLHRTRSLYLQDFVCKDVQLERGAAFLRESAARTGELLDPCAPQPITEISTATVYLGEGAPKTSEAPTWKRLYEHGLGMTRALQERVGEARPSLLAALDLLGPEQTRERAMVLTTLGVVAGRQGRVDEAMEWLDKAEAVLPGHPAIATARGDALSLVWRWKLAIKPLREAAAASPRDPMAWVKLALAEGSAGEPVAALRSAQQGLLLEPRNADLLRNQALALKELGSSLADAAMEAYLSHRPDDAGPRVRAACSAKVENCALERNPVHVHKATP